MATRKAKRKGSRKQKPAAKPRRAVAKRTTRRAAPKHGARAAKRPAAAKASAAPPSAIGLLSQHMDYATHNFDGVKRFYTELLGFSKFNLMPEMPYLAIQTGASSSLGFMPPQPGPPEQWQPPREPTIYFMVSDVDRAHRELVAKGVVFESEPRDMPWGHRVAMLRDPEGRSVHLAEEKK